MIKVKLCQYNDPIMKYNKENIIYIIGLMYQATHLATFSWLQKLSFLVTSQLFDNTVDSFLIMVFWMLSFLVAFFFLAFCRE